MLQITRRGSSIHYKNSRVTHKEQAEMGARSASEYNKTIF